MLRLHHGAALLVAVALALPVHADPDSKARVAKALEGTTKGAEPLMSFFQALVALPDFQLEGPEMRDILKSTGLNTGPAAPVLNNMQRVTKKGDQVVIENKGEATSDIVVNGEKKASVRVQKKITATVKDGGLIDVEGIEGTKPGSPWVDLRKLFFERDEEGKPIAKMHVQWGIFSKTMTVPIKTPEIGGSTTTTKTTTSGMASSLHHDD